MMHSIVATLVMAAWVFQPGFAKAVSPEELSFAYTSVSILENLDAQRQSLTAVLRKQTPSYVRDLSTNMRLAATGAAWRYNLPIDFFLNLIGQESSFRPWVISRSGALGIAQFMPSVANWRGLHDPFEPQSALTEAARYLAELRDQFGNLGLAAAAYNAGPTRLRQHIQNGRILPAETRHYVLAITGASVEGWITSNDHQIKLAMPLKDQGAKPRSISRPLLHGMPQPHQFAIGKPVPPEILASERAVLARNRWKLAASR